MSQLPLWGTLYHSTTNGSLGNPVIQNELFTNRSLIYVGLPYYFTKNSYLASTFSKDVTGGIGTERYNNPAFWYLTYESDDGGATYECTQGCVAYPDACTSCDACFPDAPAGCPDSIIFDVTVDVGLPNQKTSLPATQQVVVQSQVSPFVYVTVPTNVSLGTATTFAFVDDYQISIQDYDDNVYLACVSLSGPTGTVLQIYDPNVVAPLYDVVTCGGNLASGCSTIQFRSTVQDANSALLNLVLVVTTEIYEGDAIYVSMWKSAPVGCVNSKFFSTQPDFYAIVPVTAINSGGSSTSTSSTGALVLAVLYTIVIVLMIFSLIAIALCLYFCVKTVEDFDTIRRNIQNGQVYEAMKNAA